MQINSTSKTDDDDVGNGAHKGGSSQIGSHKGGLLKSDANTRAPIQL